jgi:ATP-dependent DNA helicase RecQ
MTSVEALQPEAAAKVGAVVKHYWGYDSLRPMQAQAIAAALARRDSLVVLPTGGGKSLCYQVPPMVDAGIDVVVSPLIALMKDQVDGLVAAGYPAAALHSGMEAGARRATFAQLYRGELRLLLVAPERLMTPGFADLLHRLEVRRFAIDEAHCISHWGHDFRPEYRQLALLREQFPDAGVHAYTATATPRVQQDIVEQLRLRDPAVLIGPCDRPNLIYRVLPKVEVRRQVLEVIARHRGDAVIVYSLSRRDTESLAHWLVSQGVQAGHYHAGMDSAARHAVQDAFSQEKLDVVVATVAFGMGIDRSNVRCVLHTGMPKSIEHYQQETGRAGRDGLPAECVLLYSSSDVIRWESLLEVSAQTIADPEERRAVVAAQTGLLTHMHRFASATTCRHKALTEYFGQTYAEGPCAACDVCLEEVEDLSDSTVLAQKVLSCVARTGQRFGVGHIVEVLRGADTEAIQRLGHESLSTYGLLKDLPQKTLQSLVYQLLDQGLLTRSPGDRPTLQLNDQSMAVLRNQREVRLIQPKKKAPKSAAKASRAELTLEGVDQGLAEHLRELRRQWARQKSVPAYVIFHDTTLVELARIRPTTPQTLPLIHGLGEKKRADFGAALLGAIGGYCTQRHLTHDLV